MPSHSPRARLSRFDSARSARVRGAWSWTTPLLLAAGALACSSASGTSPGTAGAGATGATGTSGASTGGVGAAGTGGSGAEGGSATGGDSGSTGTGGGAAATPTGGSGGAGGTASGGDSGSSGTGGTTTGGASGSSGASSGGTAGTGGSGSGGTPSTGEITCRPQGDGLTSVAFVNNCDGVLSFRGSDIEGGDLSPGEHACRVVGTATESLPAKRYWGFIGEDPGGERHTLAEFTFNTDFYDFDWYNLSHVDAHNLPLQIAPVGMGDQCDALTCADNLLPNCPEVGRVTDSSGNVISCYSPERDNPNSVVAQYFEAACDDAYSWSGDDAESMRACAGEDYDIVFCP